MNSVILSMDRYPIPLNQARLLNYLNYIFFSVFMVEIIIRLIAIGPELYLKDKISLLDGVILIFSALDIVFQLI